MSRQRIWSRRIADELWSGVVTPLTFTTLAGPMAEHMVRRRLINAGLPHLAAEPVFRLSHGRVYVNASLVAEVMGEIPAVLLGDGLLELLPESLRSTLRASGRSLLSPSLGTILLNLSMKERGWLPWARASLFRAAASQAFADASSLAVVPDAPREVILDSLDQLTARLGTYLEAVSWGMIYAYVFFHLTAELVSRWAPEGARSMPELTMGLDGIRTFEIHDELLACAATARSDATLRSVVTGDPRVVALRCARGELGSFGAQIQELLARHGHRLVGRDLSFPTWREQPDAVVEMVQKLIDAGVRETPPERRLRHRENLRRVAQGVGAGFGGTAKRLVFERAFAWCEEYYVLRENMRYHADLFLAGLRAQSLAAASRLVLAGELRTPTDVFYLEAAELRDALRGRSVEDPAERAAARRATYLGLAETDPPESFVCDDAGDLVPDLHPRVAGNRVRAGGGARVVELCGLGVSPGRTIGPARVVHSMDDLKDLRAGEVIVAASTDPSWTSLLAVGGALVLEMGGKLSHGAIVARELGIPAVVNVAHATRLLVTGDRLVVDGQTGTVALA